MLPTIHTVYWCPICEDGVKAYDVARHIREHGKSAVTPENEDYVRGLLLEVSSIKKRLRSRGKPSRPSGSLADATQWRRVEVVSGGGCNGTGRKR